MTWEPRFAGAESAHRHAVLSKLHADTGLHVLWHTSLHGSALTGTIRRARLVLNLAQYGTVCELKLSRLAVLLANSACVWALGTCSCSSGLALLASRRDPTPVVGAAS